jgi:hypothetical protein
MENDPLPPAPDFAVFQNSRTLESAIWTKELGHWHQCNKEEYPAILLIATMLRKSSDPTHTINHIMSLPPPSGDGDAEL